MNFDDIYSSDKEFLIPREVAPILGCDPQDIRVCAKQCPERLGFPVALIGHRVKIPRRAFLHWLQYGNAPINYIEQAVNSDEDSRNQ